MGLKMLLIMEDERQPHGQVRHLWCVHAVTGSEWWLGKLIASGVCTSHAVLAQRNVNSCAVGLTATALLQSHTTTCHQLVHWPHKIPPRR